MIFSQWACVPVGASHDAMVWACFSLMQFSCSDGIKISARLLSDNAISECRNTLISRMLMSCVCVLMSYLKHNHKRMKNCRYLMSLSCSRVIKSARKLKKSHPHLSGRFQRVAFSRV